MTNLQKNLERISESDLIKYYIIDNHNYEETMNYFELSSRKQLVELLKYFNIHKDRKKVAELSHKNDKRTHEDYVKIGKKSSDTQKEHWKDRSIEEKDAWSSKMKQSHSSEEYRELRRKLSKEYMDSLPEDEKKKRYKQVSDTLKYRWRTEDIASKQNATRKLNRKDRTCRTVSEQKAYDVLIKLYPCLKYDEKIDDRYPYFVDFYIPNIDLFIELQGHPSHGSRPYNEKDIKSLREATMLYGGWQKTYLIRDVEKLNVATNSNINYIRIYPNSSLEENYVFNNYKFKDIVKIIYESQN